MARQKTISNPAFGGAPAQTVTANVPEEGQFFTEQGGTQPFAIQGGKIITVGDLTLPQQEGVNTNTQFQDIQKQLGLSNLPQFNLANVVTAFGDVPGQGTGEQLSFEDFRTRTAGLQQTPGVALPTNIPTDQPQVLASGESTVRAAGGQTTGTGWIDPATGQPTPAGIGVPAPTGSGAGGQIPAGATHISSPSELAGLTEEQIFREPGTDRIFKLNQAILTSPSGEKKVVGVGSTEANNLLNSGWTLGDKIGGGTITSESLIETPDINIGSGIPGDTGGLADRTAASISVDVKSTQDQINKNLELLQTPESDLSLQVQQLLGDVSDSATDLTGRGATQLAAEEARNIEAQNQVIADKNTELSKKIAEVSALNASFQLANQTEEGRPQTLSRLRGQQAQNYKMYIAQKNLLTSEAGYMQSELLGLQGKVAAAQAAADRAVELEYSDREAAYNAKIAQLNILQPQLDKEEAKYANAVSLTLQQQANALAEEKANKQELQSVLLSAISSGITDQTVLNQIKNAPDIIEAARIAQVNVPQVFTGGGGGGGIITPTVPQQTFEEFVGQKEQQLGMSIANPEQFRGEYNNIISQSQNITLDPEIQGYVGLVKSGQLTASQALDDVDKSKKSALSVALSQEPSTSNSLQQAIAREKSQLALDLKEHKGLDSSVGTTLFSIFGKDYAPFRTAIFDKLTGNQQSFIGGVQQLVNGLSLEALIEAKSRGATFGALSDNEMQILASSASQIGTWAVKDKNNNVVGYNINEKSFKKELDNINNTLSRGLNNRQTMQDGTIWELQPNGSYLQVE